MTKKNSIPLFIIPIVIVLLVSLWLITLEVRQTRYFLSGDSLGIFLPAFVHSWRSLVVNHQLPLINLHQYLGQTFLSQGEVGALYPPTYLAVFLSLLVSGNYFNAVDIFAFMHWLLAAVFTYLLFRQLKVNHVLSALGSLLWISFPYTTTMSAVWADDNILLAYLPMNFFFLEKMLSKPSLKSAYYLSGVKAFFFFGGYVQHTIMLLTFEIPLILLKLYCKIDRGQAIHARKLFFPYFVSLMLFLVITTPLWFPMYEAKYFSADRAYTLNFSDFNRYPVNLNIFFNSQFLSFQPNSLFGASSYVYHVGAILLVFLLLFTVKTIRQRTHLFQTRTYGALTLAAFLLSTSLYGYLYQVPILNWFRGPHKFFAFFSFFLTITVVGLISVLHRIFSGKRLLPVYLLLVFSITLNITLVWQNHRTVWNGSEVRMSQPLTPEYLSLINPSLGRALAVKTNSEQNNYHFYLKSNLASVYNVFYLGGYDPLVSRLNLELAMGLNSDAEYHQWPNQHDLDYFSKWSVRYLLTDGSASQKHFNQFPQLQLLFHNEQVSLYENTKALPYVYNLTEQEVVVPHHFGVNEVNVYPTDPQAHQLVVNIAPLPRYNVFFDDKKFGRVVSANEPILINVPANTKNVLIKYEDPLFLLGVGLSLSTILTLVLLSLIFTKVIPERRKRATRS